MKTLFDNEISQHRPLAFRMRPSELNGFIGQEHIIGKSSFLRQIIISGKMFSSVFYGPPGSGKTALANLICSQLKKRTEKINAVNSNVKEIRIILNTAENYLTNGQQTVLILDEIHRFSRNQQEALLPSLENGNIVLIGITTENPFYFVSGPLLSRVRVFKFNKLSVSQIITILKRAVTDNKNGLGNERINFADNALESIARASDGDARYALNLLETVYLSGKQNEKNGIIYDKDISEYIDQEKHLFDRSGDQHYDTISAFIKSIRGSDPDASVYYLAKMLSAGEDPRFIARRITISASEDIGNADPQALLIANAASQAVEYIGMPEARIILAQVVIYLACAPKSNSSYKAINNALKHVKEENHFSIPLHLTKAGASGYKYPHDNDFGYINQKYMDNKQNFYRPLNRGYEKNMKKYLDFIKKLL